MIIMRIKKHDSLGVVYIYIFSLLIYILKLLLYPGWVLRRYDKITIQKQVYIDGNIILDQGIDSCTVPP